MNDIENIYNKIKKRLTASHLKKITIDIIDAYRQKKYRYLRRYAEILNIDTSLKYVKLFSILIRTFHPDRLSYILKQADEFYSQNKYGELKKLYSGYFFEIPNSTMDTGAALSHEESYVFDKNDFGYRETAIDDEEAFGESNLDFEEEEFGFYEALHTHFFGGLDHVISESDLKNLDGDLDLSDCGMVSIKGIENCIYLTDLNLSSNRIEKIGPLSGLTNLECLYLSDNMIEDITALGGLAKLRELDISFNAVRDINVLENMRRLNYVNLMGNPIEDFTVLKKLIQRGVIVIFEENMLI